MTSKKILSGGILAVLFLLAVSASAQESGPVVQRLSWQAVDYVSRYEAAVEARAKTGAWLEVIRKFSEGETFIDCPLFVGSYRFRVRVYDLLGTPGAVTDWVYFEVKPSRDSNAAPPAERVTEARGWNPFEGNSAPEESAKSIFRLEAAVQPLVILPFADFNEIYATSPVQPLGAALRFSALPFVTRNSVWGLDFAASWNYLANDILVTSRYTHLTDLRLDIVCQTRPFSRTSAVNFSLGFGITHMKSRFDFNDGINIQNLEVWNPSASAGVSFLIFCTNTVFLKTGIEYFHIFTRDSPTLNYLRPAFGAGWWF